MSHFFPFPFCEESNGTQDSAPETLPNGAILGQNGEIIINNQLYFLVRPPQMALTHSTQAQTNSEDEEEETQVQLSPWSVPFPQQFQSEEHVQEWIQAIEEDTSGFRLWEPECDHVLTEELQDDSIITFTWITEATGESVSIQLGIANGMIFGLMV